MSGRRRPGNEKKADHPNRPAGHRPGPAEELRGLIARDGVVLLGGVHDGLSTLLAVEAGFPALFIGGFSVAATLLGLPDLGYLTQTEIAEVARRICPLARRPVLVDADTGYGGLLNVRRTALLLAQAGAAGIFLEDQEWPKRCGHFAGKRVVERDEWLSRLRAALSVRDEHDLFVVARTDARAVLGLSEAIARARAAHDLGVDATFIEAPQSIAELERIGTEVPGRKVANMIEGGRTPLLAPAELGELGFALVVNPVAPLLATARALRETYGALRRHGTLRDRTELLLDFDEFRERIVRVGWHDALAEKLRRGE